MLRSLLSTVDPQGYGRAFEKLCMSSMGCLRSAMPTEFTPVKYPVGPCRRMCNFLSQKDLLQRFVGSTLVPTFDDDGISINRVVPRSVWLTL